MLGERYFASYILKDEDDVLYLGLNSWLQKKDNRTPLLGAYVCNAREIDEKCDKLIEDIEFMRKKSKQMLKKLKT